MIAKKTKLNGCFIIQPNVFNDKRGYFLESYNKNLLDNLVGYDVNFVQDNESLSTRGVLRGLHYQKGDDAQAKLVRVIKGSVLDVVVDIRENSASFGQHFALELSEENKTQLFMPRGFAHGFVVLSDTAIFSYKCDNFYNKDSESGIIFNDTILNIDWQLPEKDLIISDKDLILSTFENGFK